MSKKAKFYYAAVCVLSVVSVAFAIIELIKGLTPVEAACDTVIYFIFVADYIIRLSVAESRKDFIKSNILDLIAIIPFNSAFRIFRTFKILKLTQLLKLAKIGSMTARCLSKAKKFLNTNGFKYVLIAALSSIVIASVIMMYVEKMPFTDALWWSFVTTTTVGYGDLSPATGAGRIVASVLMLIGIGLIGSLTSSITTFFFHEDNSKTSNCEKVDMVLACYEMLTDEEKKIFNTHICEKMNPDSEPENGQ